MVSLDGQRRVKVALGVLLAVVVLAWGPWAYALDPALDVSQYAHTAWKIRDGFAEGEINSIAQTPDGYLWLGTEFGLLRFDGVRAVPWQPRANQHLPSNVIFNLLAARDGTLWIGTERGLASWKNGQLSTIAELAGRNVSSLLEDREGSVWVGTFGIPQGELCAIRDSGIQCYGKDGSFGDGIYVLYEDSRNTLWIGVKNGLWRWGPGSPKFFPLAEWEGIRSLGEDDDGTLLVGMGGGLRRFVNGKIEANPLPRTLWQFKAQVRMFRDHGGGLWIGTADRGLVHVHQGRTDVYTQADNLSDDYVNSLFEDREGNLWVGTRGGLDRFRDSAVATFSVKQGLSHNLATSLLASKDGSVWIGCAVGGLNRLSRGQITTYGERGKLNGDSPNSLFQDSSGRIWVSTQRAVGYLENDRFIPVNGIPGGRVLAMAEDLDKNLWLANQDLGLLKLFDRKVIQQIPWVSLGHKDPAMALAADPSHEGLWLGFLDGGVAYFKDGQVRASYGAAEGLAGGQITGFRFDHDGTLWVAGTGGVSRLKNGHFATLTSKNGLPCDLVHGAMEDDDHSLWLYMICGLVRIARSDLNAWSAAVDKDKNAKPTIRPAVFDISDGVRSHATVAIYSPTVARSSDGRLWFLPTDGVSVIDPHHIPFNKVPPPVQIEQITANGKNYDLWKGLRLPPRVHDLSIAYAALSIVVPEKVHFRVKLEGQDEGWRELNDRHVRYTNLPPRHYRFRVTACNNTGLWNEEGASLDFEIAPAYYQTNWFRALCAAAFLGLLWGLYRLRVQQLKREERKLREVVETIPTFAWTALPDGCVDFVNWHWQEYTGLSAEKTVGSGWQAAVQPEDLERHAAKWRASLASGEPFESEVRYRRAADGEYRWFLTRAVPLRDRRGKIVKWYGTSTDIEDRKHAEQLQADLAHMNRVATMSELAASLAHEIKQPIGAAVTNADVCLRLLNRNQPDVPDARDAALEMVKDARRAADIIDRVRLLYQKRSSQREAVDVNEVIAEMLLLLHNEANRHSVSIRTDLTEGLPRVRADRVQLQQVLMNLMLNGIQAMEETGGVLTIKAQVDQDGRVLISVSDTGVGLPAKKADQIFDAFFTTKPQGSGMGLAVSRSILESHGGRLWATANSGRGATFHFSLPTAPQVVQERATGT